MSTRTSATPLLPMETEKTKYYADLEEGVRRRAYELYERRGKEDGHDVDDWLQAESEVIPKRRKLKAVAPGIWVGAA
jgi:hypothetical protein